MFRSVRSVGRQTTWCSWRMCTATRPSSVRQPSSTRKPTTSSGPWTCTPTCACLSTPRWVAVNPFFSVSVCTNLRMFEYAKVTSNKCFVICQYVHWLAHLCVCQGERASMPFVLCHHVQPWWVAVNPFYCTTECCKTQQVCGHQRIAVCKTYLYYLLLFTRDLEGQSIGRWAKSEGWSVEMETVTETLEGITHFPVLCPGVHWVWRPSGQEAADDQAGRLGQEQQWAQGSRWDVHLRRRIPQGHRHHRWQRLAWHVSHSWQDVWAHPIYFSTLFLLGFATQHILRLRHTLLVEVWYLIGE